jgi:hypothetical protein
LVHNFQENKNPGDISETGFAYKWINIRSEYKMILGSTTFGGSIAGRIN